MNKIFLLAALVAISGCATHSTNVRVGTDQTYASLRDQRDAIQSVKEVATAPMGATSLGKIDAGRCHRRQGEIEPTEDLVKADLKVAAFARGADAIAAVKFTKGMALSGNCWYILSAEADMFVMPR